MKNFITGLILLQVFYSAAGTCVLESEFGFIFNCNFKKTGLFRVRNLGGVKAHIGVGFSLGDELGFPESLGNLEANRKRALSYKNGLPPNSASASRKIDSSKASSSDLKQLQNLNKDNVSPMTDAMLLPLGVPKFKPIPKNAQNLVMNAPKEYYPSGYDKNFDDNFKSKVNLSIENFTCAEQKYFPGLYANKELGCMVFHVCAVTEEGIVMKSFLCPESTLFDQTILKCNWWFYVDCKSSTYDSNIPVSKSYQLVKSLSYLSNTAKGLTVQNEAKMNNSIEAT